MSNRKIIIRDNLFDSKIHLSYGFFKLEQVFSHIEIERAYNIYGDILNIERKKFNSFRILCNGDGIKIVNNEKDMIVFLNDIHPEGYKLFDSSLIHKKFHNEIDSLLELSNQ